MQMSITGPLAGSQAGLDKENKTKYIKPTLMCTAVFIIIAIERQPADTW